MNTAVYAQAAKMANIYLEGSLDPNIIEETIFGEHTQDSFLFDDVVNYNKKQKEIDELPEGMKDFVAEHDQEEMRKKAAWKTIKKQIEEKENRRRIAHQEYLEDGQLNKEDAENAENGEEVSKNVLQNASAEEEYQVRPNEEANVNLFTEPSESEIQERKRIEGIDLEQQAKIDAAIEEALRNNDVEKTETNAIDNITLNEIGQIENGSKVLPYNEVQASAL